MTLLNAKVQTQIRQEFAHLEAPVRLLVFTETFECQYCQETRQLVEEVAALSDQLSVQVYNLVADKVMAEHYGIDKIPAIALVRGGDQERDYGIRFFGIPSGYEFSTLIQDIVMVSRGDAGLKEQTTAQLAKLAEPVHLQVFVTPTCPYCPQAVHLAHQMALASDKVTADMVEAIEFPHLSNKYNVMGVPRTVINEEEFVEGAAPEAMLLSKILQAVAQHMGAGVMDSVFMVGATGVAAPYDVIIIGGGPAGASAAIYTARAGLRTLVIDKGLTAGALGLTEQIANYPGVPGPLSGAELVEVMRKQAESFGAEFATDKVLQVEVTGTQKTVVTTRAMYEGRALILATGAMGRSRAVPGEEQFLGRGVSYCATCDGAFFRNRAVAVAGNNDEAAEEALFLTKFAERVEFVVPTPALNVSPQLVVALGDQPTIHLRLGTRLRAIEGNGHVDSIRVQARQGQDERVPVAGVFLDLQGAQPVTDYVQGQLETTSVGCLRVDDERQTSIPGVFAVGDLLCSHVKQAVLAAADGVTAAMAVDKYLHGHTKLRPDWR